MPALIHGPLSLFIVQAILIVGASRAIGMLTRRARQPMVIAEIVAGIMLGPSLLGWLWPDLEATLFPASGMPLLGLLSQLGLILFMFLVGLHLDLTEVYTLRRVAGLASVLSMVVPFVLGLMLARPLHILAPSSATLPFSLFVAISMSITAFPVLARILADQKLSATKLGHVAIACAALE